MSVCTISPTPGTLIPTAAPTSSPITIDHLVEDDELADARPGDEGGIGSSEIIIIAMAVVLLCCCACGVIICYNMRKLQEKVEESDAGRRMSRAVSGLFDPKKRASVAGKTPRTSICAHKRAFLRGLTGFFWGPQTL